MMRYIKEVSSFEIAQILQKKIANLRLHLRFQRFIKGSIRGLLIGGFLYFLLVLLTRFGAFSRISWLQEKNKEVFVVLGMMGISLVGGLLYAWKRFSDSFLINQIDCFYQLHQKLHSAWQFLQEDAVSANPLSLGLKQLAIFSIEPILPTIQPHRVAKWQFPKELLGVVLLIGFIIVAKKVPATLFQWKSVTKTSPVSQEVKTPQSPPTIQLQKIWLSAEKELLSQLSEQLKNLSPNQAKKNQELLKEFAALLKQMETGKISRKQAFEKMEELRKKLDELEHQDMQEQENWLKNAKDFLTEEAKSVHEQTNGKKSPKEAWKQEKATMDQLRELAKEQSKAIALLQKEEEARFKQQEEWQNQTSAEQKTAEKQRLQEEERRLKKKLQDNPKDEETERRLRKVQDELKQLEKERKQQDETRKKLEELEREMNEALQQMKEAYSKMSPEEKKKMDELLKQMEQMQKDASTSSSMRQQMRMGLAHLKQVTIRFSSENNQKGGSNSSQTSGTGNKQAMKDFMNRAGNKGTGNKGAGNQGEKSGENQGKDSGKNPEDQENKDMILTPGQGDQMLLLPDTKDESDSSSLPSDSKDAGTDSSHGDEHDPNLQKDPTHMKTIRKQTQVKGQQQGPSRSETILSGSREGFASRNYQKVYQDYTAVSESVLTTEKVPTGYQFYVKQYFQFIKPR